MMIIVFASILTTAIVVTVGDAATVMDKPLPFSIFEESSNCEGNPLSTGVISSLVALRGRGAFCENTVQSLGDGVEMEVYTKIKISSCDAVTSMGYAFIDAYTCSDSACSDCTEKSNPVEANLVIPKYNPLPAADVCWAVQATTTGTTILNQFGPTADVDNINTYWNVYTENSCLKDTVEVSSAPLASASLAVATTMGVLLVASLLN